MPNFVATASLGEDQHKNSMAPRVQDEFVSIMDGEFRHQLALFFGGADSKHWDLFLAIADNLVAKRRLAIRQEFDPSAISISHL